MAFHSRVLSKSKQLYASQIILLKDRFVAARYFAKDAAPAAKGLKGDAAMVDMDTDENVKSVQVRFVTSLEDRYKVPTTPIAIPSNLTRFGLSSVVNNLLKSDFKPLSGMFIRTIRTISIDVSHYPEIKVPEVNRVFKDFMAIDWGELPDPLVSKAVEVLSKPTNDSSGIESLKNVFRAAEAVEEFTGTLETLKLELDDSVGLSGENVKPLSKDVVDALVAAYERYVKYLDSFGPDEWYLRKKVETQLGTWMIHLKMRCSGLGSEWGKVTVLGTSGISGSYVEQRAP